MRLSEIMTRSVETIPATASVREAARLMASREVSFLPVVHEGVCTGVLTDRDIVVRLVAHGGSPDQTVVADVMSHRQVNPESAGSRANKAIIVLPETTPADEAARLMDDQHVHHIAVCDEDMRIVGVVSRGDLLKAVPVG
jgi:CBS domain-containing protein